MEFLVCWHAPFLGVREIEIGLTSRETFIPQTYPWAKEAQIDWYEAVADLGGEQQTLQGSVCEAWPAAVRFIEPIHARPNSIF